MGVTIQRRGKWWWLDISQDGKRFRRPTHTQEKRKAELIRHELESAILAGEWNVALALDTTLSRGIERFQAEYEPIHHAPSTRKYTRKCFERILGFITNRRCGDVSMDQIGKSDIEAYQMDRSKDVTIREPSAEKSITLTFLGRRFGGWISGRRSTGTSVGTISILLSYPPAFQEPGPIRRPDQACRGLSGLTHFPCQ